MFSVLLSGKLTKNPKPGTSKIGNPYCTASIRVPVQGQREDEPDCVFASVIAFGADAEQLARLGAGDSLSLTGSARLSSWEKDGKVSTGLNVTVTGLLSPYKLRQKRGDTDRAPAEKSAPTAPPPDEWGRTYGRPGGQDFDDAITF